MPEKILPVRAFTRAAERLRTRSFGITNFHYLNQRAARYYSDPALPRELRLAARDFIKVYTGLLATAEYNPLAYLESQLARARDTITQLKDKSAHMPLATQPQIAGVVSRQIRSELIDTPEGEIAGPDFIIKTTKGQIRTKQEDCAAYIEKNGRRVFIVADGMGGHGGGSAAARLVVETMQEAVLRGQTLLQAAVRSNRVFVDNPEIFEQYGKYFVRSGQRGAMGTAVVAAEVDTRARVLRLLHVGDPRAKFITPASEGLLTEDMSLAFEYIKNFGISASPPISDRTLEAIGKKLADENFHFGNVITSALGALNSEVGVDSEGHPYLVRNEEGLPKIKTPRIGIIEIPLEESPEPTTVALYSDGLIRGYSESDLTRTVRAAADPASAGRALIERAHNDSDDNATVAVIRLPYRLRLDKIKNLLDPKELESDIQTMIKNMERGALANGDILALADLAQAAPDLDLSEVKQKLIVYARKRLEAEPDRPLEERTIHALKILGLWNKIISGDPLETPGSATPPPLPSDPTPPPEPTAPAAAPAKRSWWPFSRRR